MHICFLCNEYPPSPHGGIGTMTQVLGRALAACGQRVSVAGIYAQKHLSIEHDQGVRVFRIPASGIPKTGYLVNGLRLRQMLYEIARENPIDVLDGPELSFSLIPKDFPAIKVIRMNGGHHFFAVTLGKKPKTWRSWLERQSFKKADHFCAVSQFAGDTTRQLLKLGDTKIEILPNPVDTRLFSPQSHIFEEQGLIIFSGTVCEKKGIRQLLEAFPKIVSAVPEAVIWVNGKDSVEPQSGGSFIQHLQQKIPARLAGKVCFNGHVPLDDLPKIYARGSVLAYPSHMETQGMVVIEGMSMGKAVVASSTGPGPEIIDDGENGLLCNPHDPNLIADKIVDALRSPDLRKKLGGAAREKARGKFSVDVLLKKNIDFYESCLANDRN